MFLYRGNCIHVTTHSTTLLLSKKHSFFKKNIQVPINIIVIVNNNTIHYCSTYYTVLYANMSYNLSALLHTFVISRQLYFVYLPVIINNNVYCCTQPFNCTLIVHLLFVYISFLNDKRTYKLFEQVYRTCKRITLFLVCTSIIIGCL